MKNLTLYITLALFGFAILFSQLYHREREKRQRVEANQDALLSGIKHWKTQDSLNAVTISQLTWDKREMKKYEANLVDSLKEQGIKLKRLQRVTQIRAEAKIEFVPVRHDSIIHIPGKDSIIRMNCMAYKDPFVSFTGCYEPGAEVPKVNLRLPVNLDISCYNNPKKIWFIKYGTKSVDLDVVFQNPYIDISYAREVKLKRR